MSIEISFSEVKKHKTKDSLWMVIHNDVYDVSAFLEEHPGGEETLLEYAGKDGTRAFEDVGHSEDARELLKKFKIGILPKSETKKCMLGDCTPKSQTTDSKPWRTFDGPSKSTKRTKIPCKVSKTPVAERRVDAVVVPTESKKLKWAVVALAGAIVIGLVLKKTLGK